MNYVIENFEGMKYVVRYPDNYREGDVCPVIVFLHGAGTKGNDINILINNMYFRIVEQHDDFPFITVAPQCPEDTWFDVFERLKKFVSMISNRSFTDAERIYLMGTSMGGYGTWQLGMSMPEVFAAIVPICGGGMYWNACRLVNLPVWAFHGAKDEVVLVEESKKMVDAVNKCGGNAKVTIYPENDHDAWSDTYSDIEVFKWLLSHTNQNISEIKDTYRNNSEIYG